MPPKMRIFLEKDDLEDEGIETDLWSYKVLSSLGSSLPEIVIGKLFQVALFFACSELPTNFQLPHFRSWLIF